MIPFLVFCSLLIPVNLWAAITPHMHSDVSMRILHTAALTRVKSEGLQRQTAQQQKC